MLAAFADEHVKAAIVEGLRLRRMDVVTAQERLLSKTDDELLLIEATREGRLVLTNDKGFLRMDAAWARQAKHHAGIVFWPQAKRSTGDIIRRLLAYARTTTPEEAADRVKFL